MTIHKPLHAVVIGCGSIGALKPDKYDSPFGENILTHAHAYHVSPDISLRCVIDKDEEKAKTAGKKWGVPYETELDILPEYVPDIVSVCAPTSEHFKILQKLVGFNHWKPKLVIAEKPFCSSMVQAKAIRKLYKDAGVPLLINYTRRFSLEYQFLKEELTNTKIYHARLLYGRGLLRDGCHGLDLFNWLFGRLHGILITNSVYDYLPDDPSVSLLLKYEHCADAQMIAIDSRKYGIFEMDIVTDNGIYRLSDNGRWLYYFQATEEETYGNYKTLPGRAKDARITDLTNALSRMVSNAAQYLLSGQLLLCTMDDAVDVHTAIDSIIQVNIETEKRRKGTTH